MRFGRGGQVRPGEAGDLAEAVPHNQRQRIGNELQGSPVITDRNIPLETRIQNELYLDIDGKASVDGLSVYGTYQDAVFQCYFSI
jgi:hypothetical protein